MKKGLFILGVLAAFMPLGLFSEPLKLTLSVSVAGEDRPESLEQADPIVGPEAEERQPPADEWLRLPLIPTKIELLRRTKGDLTFVDPLNLSKAFATVHSEGLWEPRSKPGEEPPQPRTKLMNARVPIENFQISTGFEDQRRELFLRGSSYNVFQNFDLNLTALLLNKDLCPEETFDFKDNSATCKVVLPAIQPMGRSPSNISYVKIRAFIKGKISETDLKRLPPEVLQNKERFLRKYARELQAVGPTQEEYEGYFLFANYRFDVGTEEADIAMPIASNFEWRFARSQVQGRLALIEGDFILEREIKDSDHDDGDASQEQAKISLKWGQLLVDDPLAKEGTHIEWKEVKSAEEVNPSAP